LANINNKEGQRDALAEFEPLCNFIVGLRGHHQQPRRTGA